MIHVVVGARTLHGDHIFNIRLIFGSLVSLRLNYTEVL